MIVEVRTDEELAAWTAVRNSAVPREPSTVEDARRGLARGNVHLLAVEHGAAIGCGLVGKADRVETTFVAIRVRPEARRRGVGTSLAAPCLALARATGRRWLGAMIEEGDEAAAAFAARYGLVEIGRQVELVRVLGDELAPVVPPGIELVTLVERPDLVEAAYALVRQGWLDMPVEGGVDPPPYEQWLEEEGSEPAALLGGCFVALASGEAVGFAGLVARPALTGVAENGMTTVRRDLRRRGIALALKRAQLRFAAGAGLREVVTWTQEGNDGMRAVNERLGYVERPAWISLRAPLAAVTAWPVV